MNSFIHENFLLNNATGKELYHRCARHLPIVDYHCHLNTVDLATNAQFENMTALWISPDQYKHRAMRSLGIDERFITGDATPREKFNRWAEALPRTMGNPLFHWAALELKRYFGVDEALNGDSAALIWDDCNQQLNRPSHSALQLLQMAGVEYVCTSDQWLDDLSSHAKLASSDVSVRVVPSLRADELLAVDSPHFTEWLSRLGSATNITVDGLEALESAIGARLDVFSAAGCGVADHGIDVFAYRSSSRDEASKLLASLLHGSTLSSDEAITLRSYLLSYLGRESSRRNWVMLLHFGARRETSSRLRSVAGPRGGFATIGCTTDIGSLCRFLDDLDREEELPRTVLFNLNPSDNHAFAALTGSFADRGLSGKVQIGPAWWFNDHDLGMRAHLDSISRYGLLWNFIGMATDSRSILSMCRFEYFRRIFCDWLGGQAELGVFPRDYDFLATYVSRVCYENARDWFSKPIYPSFRGA